MVDVIEPAGSDGVDTTRATSERIDLRLLTAFGGRLRLFPRRPAMVYRRIPSSDPLGCIARSSNLHRENSSTSVRFCPPR